MLGGLISGWGEALTHQSPWAGVVLRTVGVCSPWPISSVLTVRPGKSRAQLLKSELVQSPHMHLHRLYPLLSPQKPRTPLGGAIAPLGSFGRDSKGIPGVHVRKRHSVTDVICREAVTLGYVPF
eukprot:1393194-Amorphochlora_amoeboformis.AAC.1